MKSTIDAAYFREKVQMCLRLATGLSWNNPVRYRLLLLAEDFQRREKQLEQHPMSRADIGEKTDVPHLQKLRP
jgi:hypothetical protein